MHKKTTCHLLAAAAISAATAVSAEELMLEEVLVTAQKRQQDVMKVPLTVDTFSAEKIETTGALLLADMDEYIPGFEASETTVTQTSYTLRGISSPNISTGGDPSVATFYDDVYLPRAATTIAFSDMARVEVLKGPQGTLFGRNAAAGIINLVPNQPQQEAAGFIAARVGNHDLARIEGMLNLPLGDSLFLRANLLSNQRGGLVDNIGPASDDPGEQDSLTGRLALLWQISERSDWQVSYDWDDIDNAPPQAIGISEFAHSTNPFSSKVASDVINGEETREMYAVTSKLNHSFNDRWSLKFIASYRDFETTNRQDEDGTADPTRYLDTNNEEDSDIFYSEVQVHFQNDRYDWIMGATYSQEEVHQVTTVTALADSITRLVSGSASGGALDHLWDPAQMSAFIALGTGENVPPEVIAASGDTFYEAISAALGEPMIFGPSFAGTPWSEIVENRGDFTNWGVFSDVDITLNDRWNLIAGLRYSRDDKEFSWFTPATSFAALRPGVRNSIFSPADGFTAVDSPLQAEDDWQRTTGRLVAQYQINDHAMTFLSFSTGYKSGGFDSLDLSTADSPIEPEESTNYEWGIKGDFFNRSLRTQLSVFYMELDNRQRSVETRPPGQSQAIPTVINGDQEFTGVEVTLDWLASPSLRLGLVTTYREVESLWDSFFNANSELQTDREDGSTADAYTLWLDWTPDIPVGSLVFHIDYVFEEDDAEDEPDFLPEYNDIPRFGEDRKLLNARLAWTDDSGHYQVALWGRNLLDNDYINGVRNISTESFGTRFVSIREPLSWGMDFRYQY